MSKNLLVFNKIFWLALILFIAVYIGYDYYNEREDASYPQTTTQLKTKDAILIKKSDAKNVTLDKKSTGNVGDDIVAFGSALLGTPYVEAGCSKDGFDCSGFVYFVYQHHNINVPRSSAKFENFGTEISIDEVQEGDLLLFLSPTRDVIGHIGIVSNPRGKDSDFIHSTSGKEMQVVITNLSSTGYAARFVKAIRVL